MPRSILTASILLVALCAAPQRAISDAQEPEHQLVLRRVELYAGGLTGDSAIALEQLSKRDETLALAARHPQDNPARELRAALAAFDADVQRAVKDARARFDDALVRARGLADATVPLEDARMQVELMRAVYGEGDARFRDAAKTWAEVASAYPDETLPTSFQR